MIQLLGPSDKSCFVCSSKEKTAEVKFKDGTFRGVLCLTHVHEKLKSEVKRAESGAGGPKA